MMYLNDWNIEAMTGYRPKTTFYTDLSIADHYGLDAIKDTYERVFEAWHEDIEYWTEFVMALNWKIWEHYETDEEKAKLYNDLWMKATDWTYENYQGEDLMYFIRTTD